MEQVEGEWPTLDAMTERYLDLVMDRVAHNRTRAARILGVTRRTILRMLARRRLTGGRQPSPERIDAALDALLHGPQPAARKAPAVMERTPMSTDRTRASWHEVQVWAYSAAVLEELSGDRRLAALYEWKSGMARRGVWFMKTARELTASEVDWAQFPEQLAG